MEKEKKYRQSISEIKGVLQGEKDLIANMANVCAVLTGNFNFFWIGYYRVQGKELVLGPFQGPVACTRIAKGRGVCGHVFASREPLAVQNVHEFPGHIACNEASKSEVVVPLFSGEQLIGVLDVDASTYGAFDDVDIKFLTQINQLVGEYSVA